MHAFTYLDYVLLPFYVAVLFLIIKFYNNKHNSKNPILAHYFILGFKIKILAVIIYALFAEFILGGDTEMYYTAGIDFKSIIFTSSDNLKFILGPAREFGEYYEANMTKVTNFGYVGAPSNLLVIKFVALFSTVSFNCYLIISLFFSVISFFGLWCMLKVFYKLYPGYHKMIFVVFFLIPSVLFWGSGILKDSLCIGFLGIGFYSSFCLLFEKKYEAKYFLSAIISFFLLYTTKSYILYAFLPLLIFWYYTKMIARLKSFAKILAVSVPVILIFAYLVFGNFKEIIAENAAESIAENLTKTQDNYKLMTPDEGALINYGEISPTFIGLAKLLPQAAINALFRPFLWEAKKLTSLMAAIEGAFFFGLTIFVFFRRGPLTPFKMMAKDSTILFSFLFSIVFATAIGMNCFNLGTLVRYKIPCLPFYIISLMLIYKKQNTDKELTTIN